LENSKFKPFSQKNLFVWLKDARIKTRDGCGSGLLPSFEIRVGLRLQGIGLRRAHVSLVRTKVSVFQLETVNSFSKLEMASGWAKLGMPEISPRCHLYSKLSLRFSTKLKCTYPSRKQL
jgi:hypothetical protein